MRLSAIPFQIESGPLCPSPDGADMGGFDLGSPAAVYQPQPGQRALFSIGVAHSAREHPIPELAPLYSFQDRPIIVRVFYIDFRYPFKRHHNVILFILEGLDETGS